MLPADQLIFPLDLDTLVESVKFGLTISKTEPLASSIVARSDPPANVTSDNDIADYVKTYLKTIHHPIGRSNYLLMPTN